MNGYAILNYNYIARYTLTVAGHMLPASRVAPTGDIVAFEGEQYLRAEKYIYSNIWYRILAQHLGMWKSSLYPVLNFCTSIDNEDQWRNKLLL